ncbi:MAG: HAMP domain-containing protein [Rhodospirillales bacterium]|nr:HAMP domain-containing protein [Rhodospirillales bacterium]
MRLVSARLIRTSWFRMAIGYAVLSIALVTMLFSLLYWNTAVFVAEQTEETIEAEITGLAEHYRQAGLFGLTEVIQERAQGQRLSLYLLTDPNRRPIAGNLNSWPAATQPGEWIDFDYQRPVGSRMVEHRAHAQHLVLPGGFHLLVGYDVQDQVRLEQRMRQSMIWIGALALVLGLGGGLLIARHWLSRVDSVNKTAGEIMDGDMSRRVPVSGTDDELDRLARNLNDMLDRIEALMTGLRQVTDNIAHDLRSPLNRLRARLEVTLMSEQDKEVYRDALNETMAETDELLKTFNALLLIGEAESGLDRSKLETVDLTARIADAVELYEPAAEEAGLVLEADIAWDIVVRGNPNLISQAVVNLLDNALKYTPKGGTVHVRAGKTGDQPFIEVTDSGPGIPEAERARVLNRFVRLESSRSTPGSGLGLSLVAAVAKLHGAKLTLGDNAPGLQVRLEFPAAAVR